MMANPLVRFPCIVLLVWLLAGCSETEHAASNARLLNVSYDATREFYQEFNASFAQKVLIEQGKTVTIDQSHGGAAKQIRAVMDGLEADVVTTAIGYDVDVMAERTGLVPKDWQSKLPNNSAPYTSTIVFVVRNGNPKNIRDWNDLIREDVSVITANPKTSGGARFNYLAAWCYALDQATRESGGRGLGQLETVEAERHKTGGSARHDEPHGNGSAEVDAKARDFVAALYRRVPVLDSGARGATNTFLQRRIGDVLITWENEALLAVQESPKDTIAIIVPSISILTEPPVAVIEEYANKHGTQEMARAYLEHLYSTDGQQLAAKYFLRPSNPDGVPGEMMSRFPQLRLVRVADVFGSWPEAQRRHFDDGGLFDQIYEPGN